MINLLSRLFDYRLTMELEKNQKQADKIKKALCMYKPKFDEQGTISICLNWSKSVEIVEPEDPDGVAI